MKKIFSIIICIAMTISSFAQKAQISYETTTRKKFLELCRYRYDNYQGMSDLHFSGNGPRHSQEKIEYESGKEGFDLLETDYR